jgi:oxygen-independent coproporphyrinogen-3 oxidase
MVKVMALVHPVKQLEAETPWRTPRAVYVHVPFCAHRCGYCDFATVAGMDQLANRYLQALTLEMEKLAKPRPASTIFIGGGTPTYLSAGQLEVLLKLVRTWFLLDGGYEWTVEANPGTLDAEKVALLADHGVNRVSLGAQSFHRPLLTVLERNHNPDDVPRAVELVRRRIDNVSLDLIFGVPGQTLEQWQDDLDAALALKPSHLSTYGLTYEKGTPLWKQRERGDVRPVDEELERSMYEISIDRLESAGFEHYEISNLARPARRCRHNLVYWANHAYHGFGLGAARYVDGCRAVNTRDLLSYIAKVNASESPTQQEETLDPEERARETAVLAIRCMDGIERAWFRNQTGYELDELGGAALQQQIANGLLEAAGSRVRLTREGKFLADTVAAAFL